jgi:hypothetical protein
MAGRPAGFIEEHGWVGGVPDGLAAWVPCCLTAGGTRVHGRAALLFRFEFD